MARDLTPFDLENMGPKGNHEDRIPRHVIPPGLTFSELSRRSGLTREGLFMWLYGYPNADPWTLSTYQAHKGDSWGNHEARVAAWLAQEYAWKHNVRTAVQKALGRSP